MNLEYLMSALYALLKIMYIVSIVAVLFIVILQNRNPIKTVTWILVLLLLPGLGLIIYVFFGQNIRRQRVIERKMMKSKSKLLQHSRRRVSKLLDERDEIGTVQQHRNTVMMLSKSYNAVLTTNNSASLLVDGRATFNAIIDAINDAKSFIHMEYYIFAMDTIGKEILAALARKSAEGVEVKLLVDDVGSWELRDEDFEYIASLGIEIETFMPVRFHKLTSKVNYRNHRKIVVVDGQIGFTGGINIADNYIDGGRDFAAWHDLHIRLHGDSVNYLETIFIADWYYCKQEELTNEKYFPKKCDCGKIPIQIAASGPDSDWPAIMMGMFSVIASAQKYVYICTPYLAPSETVLTAIKAAGMSDIDVRILIPKRSDSWLTHKCSRSYVKELQRANVKIYFYTKGFVHAKTIVADDSVAVVGSANLDFRSFEQNFEASAFVYDSETAMKLREIFEQDFAKSEFIVPSKWKKRPLTTKISESLSRLFSPVL